MRRLALTTLLACAALALAAGAAQALVVSVEGHRFGLEPIPGAAHRKGASPALRSAGKPLSSKPLIYQEGGPVMPSNTNYAIYWDPTGGAAYPAGYQSGIDRWFEDLAHDSGALSNTDSVLTQYGDRFEQHANYDSHFAGALIDTDPYPAVNGCSAAPSCLSAAQIRGEIRSFVQANSLPADISHMYFLLTPKGVESCTDKAEKVCSQGTGQPHAAYCAYHDYIELAKGLIVYANDPFVPGLSCGDEENKPNGDVSDEEIAGGLAHEHSEGVTDPELNAWYDEHGYEVADKCRKFTPEVEYGTPLGKAPDGSSFNQVLNGHEYWYQQEWSNETGGCSQRRLQAPAIKKMKPKSGPETGGTAVVITGSGFTSTSVVDFGENESKEVTFTSPTSITAVSPAHAVGAVEVTVTTAGGTSSAENTKARFKYKKVKAK